MRLKYKRKEPAKEPMIEQITLLTTPLLVPGENKQVISNDIKKQKKKKSIVMFNQSLYFHLAQKKLAGKAYLI